MPICPNKSSEQWKSLITKLKERNPKDTDQRIEDYAYFAFFSKGDGSIPTIEEAAGILFKGKTKQIKQDVKESFGAFRFGKKVSTAELKEAQTKFAKDVSDYLREGTQIKGVLSNAQVAAIVRRASKVGAGEASFKKFTDYFEKVVDNANYDAELSETKALQKKLVKPFADAASLVNRMRKIPIDDMSAEDLTKFKDIAQRYVDSQKPTTSKDYRPFEVSQAEADFAPIEKSVKEKMVSDIESAYDVFGLTEEEATMMDDFFSAEDMDAYMQNLNESKKKVLRDNLTKIVDYSVIGLKEKLNVDKDVYLEKYGKGFVSKLDLISKVDVNRIEDNKQLALLKKIIDNVIVNDSNASVNDAYAIVSAAENVPSLVKDTAPFKKFKVDWFNKIYADTPIILQRIFGNTLTEGKIRRKTGLDEIITASTDSEREAINIIKQYKEFRKSIGLDNSAETDITIGIFSHLNDVKRGSEDADYRDNKSQLEKSIDMYLNSTDVEDNLIGSYVKDVYDNVVKDYNTISEFKQKFNEFYPNESKASEWANKNIWKKYEGEFKSYAEESINETFEPQDRDAYYPKRYKKIIETHESFDPSENMFKLTTLKPVETGRTKERRLTSEIPKGKAIDFRFEYNTFKTLQEQIFVTRSFSGAKRFYYMSQYKDFNEIFGGTENAQFFSRNFRSQYELLRFGRRKVDELSKSTFMAAMRFTKDVGSAIALGRPTQALSQATPVILAMVKNPKYMLEVITSKTPSDMELFNLAPIGSRGIEMGAVGRSEEAEAITYTKTKRGIKAVGATISEAARKTRELSLTALVTTDVAVARKTFCSYYLEYMNEVAKIPTTVKDLPTEHLRMDDVRKEALSYAQQALDKTQGASSRALLSEFKRNESGSSYNEIVKNIVMPFNNFSSNSKARLIEDVRKSLYGNGLQKAEAAKDLTGSILETVGFQAINVFIVTGIYRYGVKEVLKKAFNIDDDEDFYESLSGSFKKFYTNTLRELTVSGFGTGVENAGVYTLNRIAYLFSQDAWSDTGKDFFEWLKTEPTFQPQFTPRSTDELLPFDNIGVYGIPFRTLGDSYDEVRAGIEGTTTADVYFNTRKKSERKETEISGISRKEIELTEDQRRFFLFMGILNGVSALSGFNDADIIRGGEAVKRKIEREESKSQFPSRSRRRVTIQ